MLMIIIEATSDLKIKKNYYFKNKIAYIIFLIFKDMKSEAILKNVDSVQGY